MAKVLCAIMAGGFKNSKGTTQPSQVLSGYTFTNKDSNELTGTMPNRGAWSQYNLNCGKRASIPYGYHNGAGKVTTNSIDAQWSTIKSHWGITADKIKIGVWIGDVKGTYRGY